MSFTAKPGRDSHPMTTFARLRTWLRTKSDALTAGLGGAIVVLAVDQLNETVGWIVVGFFLIVAGFTGALRDR